MINKIFQNSFASSYFENFFKTKKRFPQSLVFEGSDIFSSYFFALELARILNCTKNPDNPDCSCTNCRWIKQGKHPCVVSVTPIDFKEDDTKTVISIKQIEKITSMLRESSDYHRFFIFSGAKDDPVQIPQLKRFNDAGYSIETENWRPIPLNRKILQEEAANGLLKSVEEAPNKTSFVFLTDNRENIISTIVSRSLIFKFPPKFENRAEDKSEFLENYPNIKIINALDMVQPFIDKYPDLISGLEIMQNHLLGLLKANLNIKQKILLDINKIELAKKRIIAFVSPKYSIESLFISLSMEAKQYEP